VAERAVAADQHADLAADLAGDLAQVAGQLGRDDLAGRDAAAEGPLEGADLRGLESADVAFDGGYGVLPERRDGRTRSVTRKPGSSKRAPGRLRNPGVADAPDAGGDRNRPAR